MRFRNRKNDSALFLMEMILCLLFFSLACTVCIRFFYAGYRDRREARKVNHFQELTVTAFELLESWTGTAQDYADGLRPEYEPHLTAVDPADPYMPEGFTDLLPAGSVELFFDRSWQPCSAEESVWQLQIILYKGTFQKGAAALFYEGSAGSTAPVCERTVRFPV